MKRTLLLVALLSLFAVLPCAADDAAFLQQLAADSLAPRPLPLATLCTSNDDCPRKQLCCYPCGIDGCNKTCMNPINGHCPLFPSPGGASAE